jgi:hypothetical protein
MLYLVMGRVYEANGFTVLYQSIHVAVTDLVLLDVNAIQNVVEDFVSLAHLSSLPESRQQLASTEDASTPAYSVTAKVPSFQTILSSAVSRVHLFSLHQYCMYMT